MSTIPHPLDNWSIAPIFPTPLSTRTQLLLFLPVRRLGYGSYYATDVLNLL